MRVITSSRRIMIFKLTVLVLAALFLLFPVVSTAYADNGISTSSAEWKSKIVEIGGIYETLTLAGGAVGLDVMEFFTERGAECTIVDFLPVIGAAGQTDCADKQCGDHQPYH